MQVSGSAMSASGDMVARTLERALANGGGSLERSRTTAWTMRREILIAAGRISLGSNAVKWQFELGDGGAQARAAERRGFVGVPSTLVEDMKRRVWRRRRRRWWWKHRARGNSPGCCCCCCCCWSGKKECDLEARLDRDQKEGIRYLVQGCDASVRVRRSLPGRW
jgi:hypothetical protein